MNSDFIIHTIDSAPVDAKPLLEKALANFGMIPNFHAVIAESPQALEAYMRLHELFSQTSFSPTEQHVVWMTINQENECHYCIPAHVMLAKMGNVSDEVIDSIRNKTSINDNKLEALRTFASAIVQKRGFVGDAEIQSFYDAGYSKQNLLEILLCLSQKVLSNYSNHITHVPVDEPFKPYA